MQTTTDAGGETDVNCQDPPITDPHHAIVNKFVTGLFRGIEKTPSICQKCIYTVGKFKGKLFLEIRLKVN